MTLFNNRASQDDHIDRISDLPCNAIDGILAHLDIIPPVLLIYSFSCLEYLDLNDVNLNEKGELLYIVCFLKSTPSLVELIIKVKMIHML
jgi:hypothetical protein